MSKKLPGRQGAGVSWRPFADGVLSVPLPSSLVPLLPGPFSLDHSPSHEYPNPSPLARQGPRICSQHCKSPWNEKFGKNHPGILWLLARRSTATVTKDNGAHRNQSDGRRTCKKTFAGCGTLSMFRADHVLTNRSTMTRQLYCTYHTGAAQRLEKFLCILYASRHRPDTGRSKIGQSGDHPNNLEQTV